jgi:hypothetical protein
VEESDEYRITEKDKEALRANEEKSLTQERPGTRESPTEDSEARRL